MLAAGGSVEAHAAAGVMYYAGLGTSGSLLPVPGVLRAAVGAAETGCRALVVAAENTAEARLVPGVVVLGASRLAEVSSARPRGTGTAARLSCLLTRGALFLGLAALAGTVLMRRTLLSVRGATATPYSGKRNL